MSCLYRKSMEIKIQKEKIRRELLNRRSRIPEEEYLERSERIVSRLLRLPEVINARTVHCYISMNNRREVNTHGLIKELIHSGHNVAVPITHTESGTLTHTRLNDFEDMQPNAWGVMEPQTGEKVAVEDLGLVIVPMVGGDLNRNRIGYGKGFYDRFLQHVSCPSVGLLFETCLMDEIPTEPFDVPLDKLVTETRVVE